MKKSIYEIILNSFAPDDCYFCQKLGDPICEKCLESRCNFGNSLSRLNSVISKEFYLSKRSGELQKIVDEFKFQSKRQNAYYLAKLLSEFLLSNSEFINNREKLVLIPVPTLSNHIRERGLDHTELLARQLAKNLKIEKSTLIKSISNTGRFIYFSKKNNLRIQKKCDIMENIWRGGRVVEGTGLENRHAVKRIEGSNPSFSAKIGNSA